MNVVLKAAKPNVRCITRARSTNIWTCIAIVYPMCMYGFAYKNMCVQGAHKSYVVNYKKDHKP
jgi:hypothetical protein